MIDNVPRNARPTSECCCDFIISEAFPVIEFIKTKFLTLLSCFSVRSRYTGIFVIVVSIIELCLGSGRDPALLDVL